MWTQSFEGSEYDFVRSMKIDVVVDVIPIDILGNGQKAIEIRIDSTNAEGQPRTTGSIPWNTGRADLCIWMYTKMPNYDKYDEITYQQTVAHEFGHTLGLGDAYLTNDSGESLDANEEFYRRSIMSSNRQVTTNDIEMVLEAYATNMEQYYLDRSSNQFLFWGIGY